MGNYPSKNSDHFSFPPTPVLSQLRKGMSEGSPEYQFYDIIVAGLRFFSDIGARMVVPHF